MQVIQQPGPRCYSGIHGNLNQSRLSKQGLDARAWRGRPHVEIQSPLDLAISLPTSQKDHGGNCGYVLPNGERHRLASALVC